MVLVNRHQNRHMCSLCATNASFQKWYIERMVRTQHLVVLESLDPPLPSPHYGVWGVDLNKSSFARSWAMSK